MIVAAVIMTLGFIETPKAFTVYQLESPTPISFYYMHRLIYKFSPCEFQRVFLLVSKCYGEIRVIQSTQATTSFERLVQLLPSQSLAVCTFICTNIFLKTKQNVCLCMHIPRHPWGPEQPWKQLCEIVPLICQEEVLYSY